MVGDLGVEPSMPKASDLQSGAVTSAARHPYLTMAGDVRIELTTTESKSVVIPFHQSPIKLGSENRNRTYLMNGLTDRCPTLWPSRNKTWRHLGNSNP
jgi:hypothetical protein